MNSIEQKLDAALGKTEQVISHLEGAREAMRDTEAAIRSPTQYIVGALIGLAVGLLIIAGLPSP